MLHLQRAFALTCSFCGHTSHITVAATTDIGKARVSCPTCGVPMGKLRDGVADRPSDAAEAFLLRTVPVKESAP